MSGLFKREKYLRKIRSFYHDDDIIKVITGVRRCGKSCLMETIADELRFFWNLGRKHTMNHSYSLLKHQAIF